MCPALVTPSLLDNMPPPTSVWARMAMAVQHFSDASGVQTQWLADTPDPWNPSETQAELLMDVLDAALDNTTRHGRAHQLLARVRASSSDLSLLVRDDGRGAPPSAFARPGGASLSRLRERADRLGGWLQIDSQPGQGTQLILSLPVPFRRKAA
jgi:signal transduction histidine kinase